MVEPIKTPDLFPENKNPPKAGWEDVPSPQPTANQAKRMAAGFAPLKPRLVRT